MEKRGVSQVYSLLQSSPNAANRSPANTANRYTIGGTAVHERMAIATRALILLALLVAAANAENFTWLGLTPDTTASSEPPARHSAAMGAWDGVYYVFGGIGNLHNGSRMFGERPIIATYIA